MCQGEEELQRNHPGKQEGKLGRAWSSIGMVHSLLMELGWGRGRENCFRGGIAAAGEVPAGPAGWGMTGRPPPVGGSKVGGVAGADGPGAAVEGIGVAGTVPMRGRVARGGGSCWEAGS